MAARGTQGGLRSTRGEATHGSRHTPVLLASVLEHLQPKDGAAYIDGTFGAGGYTRAILEAANCRVLAIDRDPSAIAGGADLTAAYPDRLVLRQGRFSELQDIATEASFGEVDGVVFDLGVSSMQLDEAARGFSFQADGPLDMRMGAEGPTAAELVNKLEAEELADIIYKYGEERHSRRIARAIVAMRAKRPFARTRELAEVVERAIPGGAAKKGGIHPATRTFQALRIMVNDELGELERGLAAAERLLGAEGRLVVVTFHSLEDRIVKNFLRVRAGETGGASRHLPEQKPVRAPSFSLLNRKAVQASAEEAAINPRARSAKLRAARRTAAEAWSEGVAA